MCDRNVDEIPCRQRPCLPPREKKESAEDVNAGLKGRPVLYTGVVWIGIVRRFLIPRTCCPTISEKSHESNSYESNNATPPTAVSHIQAVDSDFHEHPLRYKQKTVPVPLVTELPEEASEDPKVAMLRKQTNMEVSSPSPLKALVVQVHEASSAIATKARGVTQNLGAILRDGQESTAEVIETVRSEDGRKFRLAVISTSGLIGYLAGQKRGILTRLVYTVTGATAMATICYPEDTKTFNQQGLATVRHCILLGRSFLHRGPETPFRSGNMGEGYNKTKSIDVEEIKNSNDSEQSQTNLFSSENIITSLMQSLGSLGQHLEEIKDKLKETSSTSVGNASTKESVVNSAFSGISDSSTPSAIESLSHLKDNNSEKLSSKNNKNVIKDKSHGSIPYSPALPVPPNVKHVQRTLIKEEHDIINNPVDDTTSFVRKRSSEFLLTQTSDELESDIVDNDGDEDDDDDDLQSEEEFRDFADMTFVIPTGGRDEKLDGRQEYLKKAHHNKNDKTPLNKKLTVYYRDIPEEEKTSREKGYDDAYSNRGK